MTSVLSALASIILYGAAARFGDEFIAAVGIARIRLGCPRLCSYTEDCEVHALYHVCAFLCLFRARYGFCQTFGQAVQRQR